MGSWFSKKPKPKPTSVSSKDKAMLDLKRARDKLEKYQRKVEGERSTWHAKARELLRQGKKDRALLCLKMKKFKEQQLEKTDGELMNLLQMIGSIDWATQNVEVLNGLKAGNAALKKLQEEMTVEDAERIMEESAEAQAYSDQLSEVLGAGLTAEDDADVLAELQQLEEGADKETGADLEGILPTVPSHVPQAAGVAAGSRVPASAQPASRSQAPATRERVMVPA